MCFFSLVQVFPFFFIFKVNAITQFIKFILKFHCCLVVASCATLVSQIDNNSPPTECQGELIKLKI